MQRYIYLFRKQFTYIRDNITGLQGGINQFIFAEADKVALFQLASYFWNVNDYSQHTEEM